MKIPFTNIDIGLSKSHKKGVQAGIEMNAGTSLFSTERITFNALLDIYKRNPDIRASVRAIGNYTGKAGWNIKKHGESIEEGAIEHTNAFNILNSLGSFASTKGMLVRDLVVCGNAFIEKVYGFGGSVVGIKNIDARTMSIVANKKGEVLGYVQRVGAEKIVFKPEEVIHIVSDRDTENEAFGMGQVETVFYDIKTEAKGLDAMFHWYENDASPSSYIVLDEDVAGTQEEWDEIMDKMKCLFSGSKNKGKTSFVPYLKDVKTVDVGVDKFQLLEFRRFITEKVCTALAVPKFILGMTESVNNNNGEELKEIFYEGTVQPLEQVIADALTREIFYPLDQVEICFKPQSFNVGGIEKRALDEYDRGLLTVRQYKTKTGQDITDEDENHEYIDSFPPQNNKFDKGEPEALSKK